MPQPDAVVALADELSEMTALLYDMRQALERDLFPWRFPDPNPLPEFILFPRLARLERKVKR